MQSQVRFNRVPEKVWEALVQCRAEQVQQDLRPFNSRKPSRCVSSAWLGSTLQKDLKKTLRLLGMPPNESFILHVTSRTIISII